MALLDDIAAVKRREVAALDLDRLRADVRQRLSLEADGTTAPPMSVASVLDKDFGVIAEIKRKSPSAGTMKDDVDVAAVARGYEEAGAAAISVLTDKTYFNGTLDDLRAVRAAVKLPLLRKDFTVDRRQLLEARAAGADLILLIVRMLDRTTLRDFHDEARSLGLEALVEAHDERDLDVAHNALDPIPLLGVNNRDLDTLEISVERCLKLFAGLPPHRHAIAESGLHGPDEVALVRRAGYHGVLIGQALMQSPNPAARLWELKG